MSACQNSFYTDDELRQLGLKSYGIDVKISRKASIYSPEGIRIGNHVRIDDFCLLSGKIEAENYVHVAAFAALYGGDKGIYIANYATISSRVNVYSICDDYSGEFMTNPMVPTQFRNVNCEAVHIERHVIIGAGSIVLPGVELREGSAFGSFSFINHDSESWSMNVGIPFRKIRNRSKNILNLEQELKAL